MQPCSSGLRRDLGPDPQAVAQGPPEGAATNASKRIKRKLLQVSAQGTSCVNYETGEKSRLLQTIRKVFWHCKKRGASDWSHKTSASRLFLVVHVVYRSSRPVSTTARHWPSAQ